MRGLALLALNAHHLHAEKVCRRSVKRVLGFGNLFLMFIAIAYVALECTTLLMSLIISSTVVRRQWVFKGSLTSLGTGEASVIGGKGRRGNLCKRGGGDGMFIRR